MSIDGENSFRNPDSGVGPDKPLARRPYEKPAFLREGLLFETSAVLCGKTNPTQGQCKSVRSAS